MHEHIPKLSLSVVLTSDVGGVVASNDAVTPRTSDVVLIPNCDVIVVGSKPVMGSIVDDCDIIVVVSKCVMGSIVDPDWMLNVVGTVNIELVTSVFPVIIDVGCDVASSDWLTSLIEGVVNSLVEGSI